MSVNIAKKTEELIRPYEEVISDMYWNQGLSFHEISRRLNLSSGSTLYRYMKKYRKVKTREEQLQDLKIKNTGRVWTEETKKNVSEGVKRSYTNNKNLRKIRSEDNRRRWRNLKEDQRRKLLLEGLMRIRNNSRTDIEIIMKKQLEKIGWEFLQQYPVRGGKFVVSFFLPKYNLVIDCKKDFWHTLGKRNSRDSDLRQYAKENNINIAFIWEDSIKYNVHDALLDGLWEVE